MLKNSLVIHPFSKQLVYIPGILLFLFAANVVVSAEIEIRDVSATEAAEILKENPNIRVLDVRTGFEFSAGHIEDALNLNYFSLGFKKKLAELDKDVTWLVHCRTGVRSGRTLPLMKAAGFTSVMHLKDGIVDWRDSDLPLIK